tara:strand:+ start:784 stop:1347 length:564 start_codon:yes stop_codon:yes gene_type:complete
MKNLLIAFSLILLTSNLYAQETETKKEESSKMDSFLSKTGTMIKFIDYPIPDIRLSFNVAQAKIRKFISEETIVYFYQISKKAQYDTKIASIAYEDLLECIKALEQLKEESVSDLALNPKYLENKFITDDGFQLGYYVEPAKNNVSKLTWYIKLERYSSSTYFIKDVSEIVANFNTAKLKIEKLKDK